MSFSVKIPLPSGEGGERREPGVGGLRAHSLSTSFSDGRRSQMQAALIRRCAAPSPGGRRVLSAFAFVFVNLITLNLFAFEQIPGAAQKRPIALVGGTIHPVTGPAITSGTLVFNGGKITAFGKDVAIPDDAERIEITGKHVYPGLFDAMTSLGLVEIPSVRGTVDDQETGGVNPNVRAEVAFNPDSELIPVTRSGGVLLAVTAPVGGLIAGTGAVMRRDGWTWEDMTVTGNVGLNVYWPRMAPIHT